MLLKKLQGELVQKVKDLERQTQELTIDNERLLKNLQMIKEYNEKESQKSPSKLQQEIGVGASRMPLLGQKGEQTPYLQPLE